MGGKSCYWFIFQDERLGPELNITEISHMVTCFGFSDTLHLLYSDNNNSLHEIYWDKNWQVQPILKQYQSVTVPSQKKQEELIVQRPLGSVKRTPVKVPLNWDSIDKSKFRMLRIVCISDTHNYHTRMNCIPEGDIFICAGDFTHKEDWRCYSDPRSGVPNTLKAFNEWLGKLTHKHKIVISGNHEIGFNHYTADEIRKNFITHATYLQDESLTVEGIHIYGTPRTMS